MAKIIGPLKDTDPKFYTLKPLFWSDGPLKILGSYVDEDYNNMMYLNFDAELEKAEAILQNWIHRNLTLIGKITVINTLTVPIFIHRFMALPTPSQEFVKKYKSIVIKFLWKGSVPKIRYTKLIQDYTKGGLKLVDLEIKNHALKSAWITRWSKNGKLWTNDLNWLYLSLPGKNNKIWHHNLNYKDACMITGQRKDMGAQILLSWALCTYTDKLSVDVVNTMSCWFNSVIRQKGLNKPFEEYEHLNTKLTLMDIYDDTKNSYISFQELVDKKRPLSYTFLTYYALLTSIPVNWKNQLKELSCTNKNEQHKNKIEKLMLESKASRYMYWHLLEQTYILKLTSLVELDGSTNFK